MKGSLKAGLIVGFVQLLINVGLSFLGAYICCGFCPLPWLLWFLGGAFAGWLSIDFSQGMPERPVRSGAIAGFLSALGCLLGLLLPVGVAWVLDRIPGFEDVITMEVPPGFPGLANLDTVESIGSILMLVLVLVAVVAWLLLSVLLTTGAGAAAAKYRSEVKGGSRAAGGGAAQPHGNAI